MFFHKIIPEPEIEEMIHEHFKGRYNMFISTASSHLFLQNKILN
jgi:hypothetical protein